jgi:hypothetical protein
MLAEKMIATHPDVKGNTNAILLRCIEDCYQCAQTCTSCADACLAEAMVAELRQCIRLNLDCADLCLAAGSLATRRTGSNEAAIVAALDACAIACRLCGDECARHAETMEHCRICADACRQCEESCSAAIESIRG